MRAIVDIRAGMARGATAISEREIRKTNANRIEGIEKALRGLKGNATSILYQTDIMFREEKRIV